MYLSSKPKKMKNMLNYAVDAQKIFSAHISGCDSIYDVNIEKKIRKQIGYFQREFNKLRKKRHKELLDINASVK